MDIRVLVADPLPLIRRGLSTTLSGEPDMVVVGEAEDALQATAKARRLHPDIILTELELPGGGAYQVSATMASEGLAPRVVVLAQRCEGQCVSEAVSAGVLGYISKSEPASRICSAIRRVVSGNPVFSEEAQLGLQLFLQQRAKDPDLTSGSDPTRPLITERELQVLQCIAEGKSVEETSQRLHTSVSTIKNQRQSIFVKLNVPNAPGAVYEAMHRGLIT